MERMIFAAEYDGTYRREELGPTDADVERVRRFREAGGLFGIITDRDVFQVMAVIGVFKGEFDFIVCSSGACGIVKSSDIAAGGTRLESVGVAGELPVQLYCNYCHQSLLPMLYDFFEGVGMTGMQADIPGFRGGPDMAHDYGRRFDPEKEKGCGLHFWYHGGQFFNSKVGREALDYVFPFTQCKVSFKDELLAGSARDSLMSRFPGAFNTALDGCSFAVTAAGSDRVYGIRRFAEIAGVSEDRIVAVGSSLADRDMLCAFRGIALEGSDSSVTEAAASVVTTFGEAIGSVMDR